MKKKTLLVLLIVAVVASLIILISSMGDLFLEIKIINSWEGHGLSNEIIEGRIYYRLSAILKILLSLVAMAVDIILLIRVIACNKLRLIENKKFKGIKKDD